MSIARMIAGTAVRGGWDISTASYVQNFSVAAFDTAPTGLFFKPDGTRMYVAGAATDRIVEYSLSSAWDISTALAVRLLSVAAQVTSPAGLFFKPNGTKMYVVDSSAKDVNEYSLSSAWNISTASFVQSRLVTAGTFSAFRDLFFKPDGTKMYIADAGEDYVWAYSLSSAWDVSTASFAQRIDVTAQGRAPTGVFFKPDGLKMYTAGTSQDEINEYSLSSAWDVSTASYVQNFSVAAQETDPISLFFRPDGLRFYVLGNAGDDVNEYRMSTTRRSMAFRTAGTHTFTVPGGVTSVTISLVGAAGGGASGYTVTVGEKNPVTTDYFGGDGGSGASAIKALTVTPGETLTVVVGAGGAGGVNVTPSTPAPGSAGTDSTLTQSAVVVARADAGSGAPSASDGAGGLASASVGDTATDGVAGAGGNGGYGYFQNGSPGSAGAVVITW